VFRKKERQSGRTGGILGRFRGSENRTSGRTAEKESGSWSLRLRVAFSLCFWILVGTGIVLSFGYLNRYIQSEYPQAEKFGPLELVNVPEWVESGWIEAIKASVGNGLFALDERSARQVSEKLSAFSWLEDVRVRVTPSRLRVEAVYRKPLLRVKTGTGRWLYLDSQAMVMDAPELPSLQVVELKGLPAERVGIPGQSCSAEEVSAVLVLLEILGRMDQKCCSDKPLRNEIAFIDVSNWVRGKKTSEPQIILGAKDGTPIYWGAPYGKAALYLEADETEKLSVLYTFYSQNGYTLQGKVKYLELRTPVGQRPRPR